MAISLGQQEAARQFLEALQTYKDAFLLENYPMIELGGPDHYLWVAYEHLKQLHPENDHELPQAGWEIWRKMIHTINEPPEDDHAKAYEHVDLLIAWTTAHYGSKTDAKAAQKVVKPKDTSKRSPVPATKTTKKPLVGFDASSQTWTACGTRKGRIPPARHAVIKALLEAGEAGLRKQELERKSE